MIHAEQHGKGRVLDWWTAVGIQWRKKIKNEKISRVFGESYKYEWEVDSYKLLVFSSTSCVQDLDGIRKNFKQKFKKAIAKIRDWKKNYASLSNFFIHFWIVFVVLHFFSFFNSPRSSFLLITPSSSLLPRRPCPSSLLHPSRSSLFAPSPSSLLPSRHSFLLVPPFCSSLLPFRRS